MTSSRSGRPRRSAPSVARQATASERRRRNREAEARHRRAVAEEDDSDDRPERDGGSLAGEAADPEREEEAGRRERQARPIRCERAAHREQREEDHRHRDELEAVHPACARHVRPADDQGEHRHRDRRREREAEPGRCGARHACVVGSDRDAELARHRAGQQVRHGDELGELLVPDPAPPSDVLVAEVADVGDRPAERRQPEAERRREDVGGRPQGRVAPGFQRGSSCPASAFAARDRMKRRSESLFR